MRLENVQRNPVFTDTDRALARIEETITAVEHLNALYDRQQFQGISPDKWRRPKGLRPTVGHIMFLGPAGCGKTTYANKVASMMGLKEGINYHKVSADSFPTVQDFIKFLQEKLTWDGYLCDNGCIRHDEQSGCIKNGRRTCKIVDPKNPRGPVPPVAIFFDEIHMLPAKIQDKFGVIFLEFYYNLMTSQGTSQTIYFPRFTILGATTDIGRLTPALQSRFKMHVPVSYYSDEEMTEIVTKMCKDRGMSLPQDSKEIIARCSQGVPRKAESLLDQLLDHGITGVIKHGWNSKDAITSDIVSNFCDRAKHIVEGFTFEQIELLSYLANGNIDKSGNRLGLGITKICHRFGIDKLNFLHNWEPILQRKGYICSGSRGREITQEGLNFLDLITRKYTDKNWSVH